MEESTLRYAVVSGSNKGIGLEICKQLAKKGITVILTARNKEKGIEAVEKLKGSGLHNVIFHQLDVLDSSTISSLAHFVQTHFGKLDILVNNAGIGGAEIVTEALEASNYNEEGIIINWNEATIQTYDLAKECVETNYYGAKRLTEALIPLLQLSDSARIVNVSSTMGLLENIPSESIREELNNIENLTEEKVDKLILKFLNDFKEDSLQSEGWPVFISAYKISKACLSAYTRILAKKYPSFLINCVCPGFVKTDINYNVGKLTVEEGAESPVRLALFPNGNPSSGLFYDRHQVSPF